MNLNIEALLVNNLDQILTTWFIIDENERFIRWSEAAHQLFGYKDNEVLNRSIKLILPEEREDNELLEEMSPFLHSGELINHRMRFQKNDGIILDTEMSVKQLKANGSCYYLITLINITEIIGIQKLVYSKMEQLEKKLAFSDDSIPEKSINDIYDAILVSVTAGQGLRFNRAFLFIADEDKNELQGIQAIGPSSPEEADTIYRSLNLGPRTLNEAIANYQETKGETDDLVNTLAKKVKISLDNKDHILIRVLKNQGYCLINNGFSLWDDPTVKWLCRHFSVDECIIVTISWHGFPIGLLIADNRITQRKITHRNILGLTNFAHIAGHAIETIEILTLLEEKIIQVRNANLSLKESQTHLVEREKLAAMGVLMAQMAHEIRGPLAIIGGYARRVFNQIKKEDNFYDPLNRIVDTVKTLESVLIDILEKAHPNEDELQQCDIHIVMSKVMNLLENEIHTREISVNLNIQGDLPKIQVKEHHLFEILNNLVKNALEATSQNGLLSISAFTGEKGIVINVKDSGSGITPEKRKKLFTPFFTTKELGTGLGLAIVKKLIDEYEGSINVVSVPNSGSTFTISFPNNIKYAST